MALLFYVKSRRAHPILFALAAGVSAGIAIKYHVNGIGIAAGICALLICNYGWRALLQKQTWAFGGGLLLTVAPAVLWIASDSTHRAAFRQIYLGRAVQPFTERLAGETVRYSDFLGIGNWRLGFALGHIPLRAHIALIFGTAALILIWRFRSAAIYIMVPLAANMGFWVLLVNKSSRYFAVVAPLFALAAACAAAAVWPFDRWPRRRAAAGLTLLALSGVAGGSSPPASITFR